ncbi:MAG: hypothetical protein WDA16_13355 [Candidatus Thermoplasmatota archaeon]
MRSSLCLFVAVLMLGGAFAGCFSGATSGSSSEKTQTQSASATNSSINSSLVDDGSGNMTVDTGHMAHMHDYWQGRERVTLMETDLQVDVPTAMMFTFFDLSRGTAGVGGVSVNLPDEQIVFEGTGKMEFTATWTDPTITGMGLTYKTAASPSYGAPKDITSGTPAVIVVAPDMTDMPHSKTSRWGFLLAPDKAGEVIYGKIHVKVDIVRMRDITLFPGHPELFHGLHTLELWKGSASSSQTTFVTQGANAITKSPGQDDTLQSKVVVPMETLNMTANLTVKTVNSDVGKMTNLTFLVKAANTNRYLAAKLIGVDAATNTYRYAWMVDMRMTDSPYAKESSWRFDVQVDTDPSQGTFNSQCGGCSNAKIDYDLEVIAYDGAVDGATKLMGGGRGG